MTVDYFRWGGISSCIGVPWGLSGREPAWQCRRNGLDPWIGKSPWRRTEQPPPVFLPGKSNGRGAWRATVHAGDKTIRQDWTTKGQQQSSQTAWVKTPSQSEKAMAPPLQYFCLENPMDEEPGGLQSMGPLRAGDNWATSLSLFTFMHWRRKWQPSPVSCLENPRDGEPGGLPSMGSHRVGHDCSDLAAAAAVINMYVTFNSR